MINVVAGKMMHKGVNLFQQQKEKELREKERNWRNSQDREDVRRLRQLFWEKIRGEITQAELEREVEMIMGRQLHLLEAK